MHLDADPAAVDRFAETRELPKFVKFSQMRK